MRFSKASQIVRDRKWVQWPQPAKAIDGTSAQIRGWYPDTFEPRRHFTNSGEKSVYACRRIVQNEVAGANAFYIFIVLVSLYAMVQVEAAAVAPARPGAILAILNASYSEVLNMPIDVQRILQTGAPRVRPL